MSEKVAQFYSDLVEAGVTHTEMNGRLLCQQDAERLIVPDIINKMCLNPSDSLLEIGCGVGSLLIPISYMVASTVGIDVEEAVNELQKRSEEGKIKTLPGMFPDVPLEGKFSKILVYSVLVYIQSEEKALHFIDHALEHLRSDGCMMLGDINSTGRKDRFSDSESGRQFALEWAKQTEGVRRLDGPVNDAERLDFTDEVIMRIMLHIRKKGWNTEILRQSGKLPFGHSREDILVTGPDFAG